MLDPCRCDFIPTSSVLATRTHNYRESSSERDRWHVADTHLLRSLFLCPYKCSSPGESTVSQNRISSRRPWPFCPWFLSVGLAKYSLISSPTLSVLNLQLVAFGRLLWSSSSNCLNARLNFIGQLSCGSSRPLLLMCWSLGHLWWTW